MRKDKLDIGMMRRRSPHESARSVWKESLIAKLREMNVDPTRCKCIRLDGEEMKFPFIRKHGQTKLNINGAWLPLVMSRGEFHCGPFSFKRIYYPDASNPTRQDTTTAQP